MKRKEFWGFLVIGIMCFALFATVPLVAGGQKSASSKKTTIMYVSPIINDPTWLVAKKGFEDAAAEFGFEGIWTGADEVTIEKIIESFENVIVQRPDGIILCPLAPAAFNNSLRNAKEAGIVVSCAAVDATGENLRTAFVGTDLEAAGVEHIQKIISKLPQGAEVRLGVLMSNLDAENQLQQVNAAEKYMKDKGIPYTIVDKQADKADPNVAVEVVTAMLRAHPDINAIMSVEGGGTPGVGKALEELGLQNKVVAICMDGTELNLDQIKNGRIAGVMAQNVYRWGYDTGKYTYQAIKGEKVPSFTDSGVVFVDKSNVATYDPAKKN